jgi:Holliday junction resolvase
VNSKRKGGRGEREFASFCRDHGYASAQRGQQFQGGVDSPDVKGLPGVHVEVKRVERLNISEAMRQAVRDCEGKAVPIVAHRRNREEWFITMQAADWFALYREWEAGMCLHEPTL